MTTAHDFDFLHGTWHVHNRRRRRVLAGDGAAAAEWYAFDGGATERPLWNGRANVEEYHATLPDGTPLHGLALRLYEPAAAHWTIHWSNAATGTLDAPMTGTFVDGVGEFFGDDRHDGRPIRVRFRWTSEGPDAARWEQAFSADAGATWETNWIMDFTRTAGPASSASGDGVVELRRYVLHPGRRDTLIDLFDREFVETQEATGMRVVAQFRDIDRPDVFVWLRDFPDMATRAASLGAFYGGPVWGRHGDAANATMISSDDVRLLRAARPGSGIVATDDRPGPAATAIPDGLVVATIYTLAPDAAPGFADFFARALAPRLALLGARSIAMLETEPSANTFPRLPVREGEQAFVWLTRFADVAEYDRHAAALAGDRVWAEEMRPALERQCAAPVDVWRLTPTARSRAIR